MGQLTFSLITFAQTVSQKTNVTEEQSLVPQWIMLMIVVLLIGLPFLLGSVIARALKMKDLSIKIGVILFAFTLGMSNIGWQYVAGFFEQRRYDEQLATWEERQKKRDQITKEGGNEHWNIGLRNSIVLQSVVFSLNCGAGLPNFSVFSFFIPTPLTGIDRLKKAIPGLEVRFDDQKPAELSAN